VSAPPPARDRRRSRARSAYRALRARQRRLETWLERRYPKLYDARHAATGIGRALWPLVGPLLAALIVLPIVALLAALAALLGLHAPSIDLPSVDLPDIPLPDVTAPAWLRAVGAAIAAALAAFGSVAHYLVVVFAVILGVLRTREVRRKRTAAEQVGRPELMRRLAVALRAAEASARACGATTMAQASVADEAQEVT
jgi:hypothetical protein